MFRILLHKALKWKAEYLLIMSLSEEGRISVRLDSTTKDLLQQIAKDNGISLSMLIRLAVKDFIMKADSEKEVSKALILLKINYLLKEVNRHRFILHLKRQTESWLKQISKAEKGELQNPTLKKMNILNYASKKDLERLKKLERRIKSLTEKYLKLEREK